jgi:hypothetical protein
VLNVKIMKVIQTSISIFLVFASVVMRPTVSSAEWVAMNDPAPKVIQKADLPVGGITVPQPKDKQVVYYVVSKWKLWEDTANAKKSSGLYGSTDGGQTWILLTNFFEFKSLFIHPASGELFAVIEDNVIAPNEKGFLTVHLWDKAIRSIDGKQWKDIMGKQQRASGLSRIFVDPEHPNRVRLRGHAFRPYELVAVDDNYSEWKRVMIPTGPVF